MKLMGYVKKVPCLICWKEYFQLQTHLIHTEGITCDEYKLMFPDAPFNLVTNAFHRKMISSGLVAFSEARKGKSLEETFGVAKAGEITRKQRGRRPWNKGLSADPNSENYDHRVDHLIEKGAKTARKNYESGKWISWKKGKTAKEYPHLIPHGVKHSRAIRKKSHVISESKRGKKNPMRNPETKKRMIESITRTWNQSHMKKKQSKTITKLWKDETYRNMQKQSHRKFYENPENIERYIKWMRTRPTKLEIYLNEQIMKYLLVETKQNHWHKIKIDGTLCAREIDISFLINDDISVLVLCDGMSFHGEENVFGENTLTSDYCTAQAFLELGYSVFRYSEDEIKSNFAIWHLVSTIDHLRLNGTKKMMRCWFDT